jgi:hypothetical protein
MSYRCRTLVNKMLTPEQIASLTKMYEDIQTLKTEVTSLRAYKDDSMAAIKLLMTDKDKLIEEVKTLKEAKGPASAPPLAGLFGGGSTSGFTLVPPAAASTGFMTQSPAAPTGFVVPSQPAATSGFSFAPSSTTPAIGGMSMGGAAGKPTQGAMSLWGARQTR